MYDATLNNRGRIVKFVITAGHSNTDPGAVQNGHREADLMTEFRNLVAGKLRGMGHSVETDGEGAVNLPLAKAIELIKPGIVAVEFHTNSFTNPSATGVETISLPKDKPLAQRLSAAIGETMSMSLRGESGWIDQSKSARGRLGFINAGGLIVETFFLSNPVDLEKWQTRKSLVATAVALALAA